MKFSLNKSIEILERTPGVLQVLLKDISIEWTSMNEGGDSWSVFDIIGHLVHAEKTDWIPRMDIILSGEANRLFPPFNRFAQFEESRGKNLLQLLDEFNEWRTRNVAYVRSKKLTPDNFGQTGTHPAFGTVTLSQLFATWTAHDLNHLAQITRVMAKQYKEAVGPWVEYLRILREQT